MIDYSPVFAAYEAKRDKLRAWMARHYLAAFGLTPPGRVLDIGCGSGFWSSLFAEAGFTVTGFDIDRALIEAAAAKYPGITFRVADAAKPLRYRNIDLVFIRTIAQFYAPRLEPAETVIRNALTYVADGGLVLISAYTDGTGTDHENLVGGVARHHPVADFLAVVEAAGGEVAKTTHVGNYLQIAARRP